MTDSIDYPLMIDTAMRNVVKDALKHAKIYGLPGDHHFFISYRTDAPGIGISDNLKARYPREITIVLQHQYWDLTVEESHFSVSLSFNNIPEKLVVPYTAITAFADPSVKFGLQFNADFEDAELEEEIAVPPTAAKPAAKAKASKKTPLFEDAETTASDDALAGANVISLDSFRKK